MLKKSQIFRHLIWTVSLILSFVQTAHSKETITWLWYEQAPYFLGKGSLSQYSIGGKLTTFFQKNLPEYNHLNIKVNVSRYNIMMKKPNTCIPIAWLSPNEKKFHIQTRPHTLEPPAGIIIHESLKNQFDSYGKRLSLKKLLQKKGLRLGVLNEMEYSSEADEIIKKKY